MSAIENAASNVIKKLRDNKIKADILNSKDYKDFAQYFKNGVKEKDLDPDFKSAFNNYTQYYKEIMNNSKKAEKNFIQLSFDDEQNENSKNSRDASDELFKLLMQTKLNLVKDALELEGVFFGKTTNTIIYDNELVDKPLSFGGSGSFGGGAFTLGDLSNLDISNIDTSILRARKIPNGMLPSQDFIESVRQASSVTGIPTIIYWLTGFLESAWGRNQGKGMRYGGYFGQEHTAGKSIYQQAIEFKGIWDAAMKNNPGYSGAIGQVVWYYMCHNLGPGGAKKYNEICGGNVLNATQQKFDEAANYYVNNIVKGASYAEKRKVVPEILYVLKQLSTPFYQKYM